MKKYDKFWKNNPTLKDYSFLILRRRSSFVKNHSFWLNIDIDQDIHEKFNAALRKYIISLKNGTENNYSNIKFFNEIILSYLFNINKIITSEDQKKSDNKNVKVVLSLISIFNFINEVTPESPPEITSFVDFLEGDDRIILLDYATLIINTLRRFTSGENIEVIINEELVEKMQSFEDILGAISSGNLLSPGLGLESLSNTPTSSAPPSPVRAPPNSNNFDITTPVFQMPVDPIIKYTSTNSHLLTQTQKDALLSLFNCINNTDPKNIQVRNKTDDLLHKYELIPQNRSSTFLSQSYHDMKVSYMINNYKNELSPNLNYRQQLILYGFIAMGAIVGAIAGLVIGIAIGATIGGGVGSALPALGTAFGGLVGGGIGGMFAAIKGLGFGIAVGAAVGFSVLGVAGMGAGVVAYRLKKKNYLSKKPTDLDAKTSNAIKNFANSLAPTPQTPAYQPINA